MHSESERDMNKPTNYFSKSAIIKALAKSSVIIGLICFSWSASALWEETHYSILPIPRNSKQTEMDLVDSMTRAGKSFAPGYKRNQTSIKDDFTNLVSKASPVLYNSYPVLGQQIGILSIPSIDRIVPIIQGTGTAQLKKGAGHFSESALPGEMDNVVLSGHRETAFRGIGAVQIGDLVIAETSAGKFTYQVEGTRIVDQNDLTVIVQSDTAILTLTTCYPFNTPGYSPQRYIVSATLISSILY